MLGWMLKRGENAPDAADEQGAYLSIHQSSSIARHLQILTTGFGLDTTSLDQPDTPAPVFAARAIRSALFGTVAPSSDETLHKGSHEETSKQTATSFNGPDTPSKPQGILLTPGTGTSRRKRVSFGRDIGSRSKPNSKDERIVPITSENRGKALSAAKNIVTDDGTQKQVLKLLKETHLTTGRRQTKRTTAPMISL